MKSRIFSFVIISIVCRIGVTMTIRKCEGELLTPDCTNNGTINIISANYGRTSSLYCPGRNSETTLDCIDDASEDIVTDLCHGNINCNVFANNFVFGDPCRLVTKYLEVNFTCDKEKETCETLNCNEASEVCVDVSSGAICGCAENYKRNDSGSCQATTCGNSADSCNGIAERCVDENPGVRCVCQDNYVRNSSGECTAITCGNSADSCNGIAERCVDENPGVRCVCQDNYFRDSSGECTATTCGNSADSCNGIAERCVDENPGIRCVCQDNYFRNSSGVCTATMCENSADNCNGIAERCVDENPGIRCVCQDNYFRNSSGECIASTCGNSADSCNGIAERCVDENPGIRCVCQDNYFRNSSGECIASTCGNSADSCNGIAERCVDENPGIRCVCQDNYVRNSSGECIAVTCLNTASMCDGITEVCEDLNPGIHCVCAEGYMEGTDSDCRPMPTGMEGNDRTTETPENFTVCPAEVIVIGGISLSFPLAKSGEQVDSKEACILQLSQNGSHSLATRVCEEVWQEPKLQDCSEVETLQQQLNVLLELNLKDTNVDEYSRNLALLAFQTDDISVKLLESLIEYLAKIVALGSASFEVTDAVIAIVSIITQVNEEILQQAKGVASVIPLMEEQISNVQRNRQNYSQTVRDLDVRVIQVPKLAFDDEFKFISYGIYSTANTEDEDLSQEASITIPSSVLKLVDEVYPSTTTVPISFVTYQDSRLFRKDENQTPDGRNFTEDYIGSYVISSTIELPNITIRDLPQNSSVTIKFSNLMLQEIDNGTEVEVLCVYWEYTSASGEGRWSQAGCRKLSSGFEEVTCSCNHLTSFAVLVRTYYEEETDLHLVLQLISVIGCIISIIGLSLSLSCMVILRSVRVKQQTHLHFNLCLALLGLYLSFLFGIGQAEQPETCRRMTSVIYFFCLSSVAWMSVEAFYIYKLIWKCKQHNIKHLIPVGVLFAWGVPGIAAIVIYFLDNTHDYEAEADYCFLHPGPVLLFGFLLELLILFLYNSIVFVLVTYRISCRKIKMWNKEDRRQELTVRLKSTLLFWLLLGMSWIFGFLATFEQPTTIVFQIIFCVLLSLKGFFMFYMLIVQNPEMKKSLSSVSTLRIQSASLQFETRSTAALSTKKESRQEMRISADEINNQTDV